MLGTRLVTKNGHFQVFIFKKSLKFKNVYFGALNFKL
jgi:hypothetical protein